MPLRDYVPSGLLLLLASGEAYLTYGFMVSNLRIPEGAAFTFRTLVPSTGASLLAFSGFILLLPGVRDRIRARGFSERVYWTAIIVSVLLSLLLAVAAILSGSIEYTQFQAAAS